MLSPKRTKYRKAFKGRISAQRKAAPTSDFGCTAEGDGA